MGHIQQQQPRRHEFDPNPPLRAVVKIDMNKLLFIKQNSNSLVSFIHSFIHKPQRWIDHYENDLIEVVDNEHDQDDVRPARHAPPLFMLIIAFSKHNIIFLHCYVSK